MAEMKQQYIKIAGYATEVISSVSAVHNRSPTVRVRFTSVHTATSGAVHRLLVILHVCSIDSAIIQQCQVVAASSSTRDTCVYQYHSMHANLKLALSRAKAALSPRR